MSDTNTKIENQVKKPEIKELTLEDLKRVRGGGGETQSDDYNRDKCFYKEEAMVE